MKKASICGLLGGVAILLGLLSGCSQEKPPVSQAVKKTTQIMTTMTATTTRESTAVTTSTTSTIRTTRTQGPTKAPTTKPVQKRTTTASKPVVTKAGTTVAKATESPVVPGWGQVNDGVYTAVDGSYRIQLPEKDWVAKYTEEMVVLTPGQNGAGMSMNILISPAMHEFDQLTEAYFQEVLSGTFQDLTFGDYGATTIDGRPSVYMTYSLKMAGISMQYVQYMIDGPEHMYTITYSGLETGWQDRFDASARSFQLL